MVMIINQLINELISYLFADVNECISGLHNCNVNARCGNVVGSYFCQCHQGYSGDGHSCSGQSLVCFRLYINIYIYMSEREREVLKNISLLIITKL